MPVTLSIKGVPDSLADRLRARAASHHRSLQGELMAILSAATEAVVMPLPGAPAMPAPGTLSVDELLARVRGFLPNQVRDPMSAASIVREMRDARDPGAVRRRGPRRSRAQ